MLSTLRTMLIALTTLSIALTARSGVAQVGTPLPMNLTYDQEKMRLTVPDRDTSVSAYGGRLRLYDIHIAKMFEVTYVWCEQGIIRRGMLWSYWARNGSIDMGNFYVSCREATTIHDSYETAWNEPTEIYWISPEGDSYKDWDIPVLDVTTETKIDRWLRFVDGFQPI